MNFCYLLESTDLGGGVRVILDQARALIKRGHQVEIRALKGNHAWYPHSVTIRYVSRLDMPFEAENHPDALICTYWTTIAPGKRLNVPVTLHLCQGYEGDIPELAHVHADIVAAYQHQFPKITIGEWLVDRLYTVFGRDRFHAYNIGQIVDLSLFQRPRLSIIKWLPWRIRHRMPINIMAVGDYLISCKGIADALIAVVILRQKYPRIRLIRASLWPVTEDEQRITRVDESYVCLSPRRMVPLFMKTDLLLAPSLPPEGFGLPAAEAMACGIPVVLTKIPSYLGFDGIHDYACFVDVHAPEAIAECVTKIINSRQLYSRLQQRGLQVAHNNFNSDRVAQNIENLVLSCLLKKR